MSNKLKTPYGVEAVGDVTGANVSGSNAGDQDITGKADKVIDIENKTDSYTLVLTDSNKLIEIEHADAKTLTIPKNSVVAFPTGTTIGVIQKGAGTVTIAPVDGDVTILSKDSNTDLNGQYAGATLTKCDTDEWYLNGDLA